MFKNIKKIKDVGIYKDFKWDGTISPLSKHSLFFGFNGSGKTTLSRIFAALASGNEAAFEKGYEIELTTYDGHTLKIDKSQKYENVLVYNEDYVEENFSWQDADKVGAKAFVVIGKKSKEQEESLRENTARLEQFRAEMALLEKDIKTKVEEINKKSTEHARIISNKLTPYKQDKYKKYAKTHIEKDVEKLKTVSADVISKIEEAFEIEKLSQKKLDSISPIPSIDTRGLVSLVERIKEYIELGKPDRVEVLLSALELDWVKSGAPLHVHKDNCLFCGGSLSSERKDEINRVISNAVAKFVATGVELIKDIEKFKLPPQLPLLSNSLYSDMSSELSPIIESYGGLCQSVESWMLEAKDKVEAHKDYRSFDLSFKTPTDSINTVIKTINNNLRDLAEKHNNRSNEFQKVQEEAICNVELLYLSKYRFETEQLLLEKGEKEAVFNTAKSNYELAKSAVDEIQRSLASEGKAALEINDMLGRFLGRKDIRIDFSEEDSKFVLKRNEKIAKKLSEGEKTAISFCYFLISVRANPETVTEKIVVIDDPVTSLDSTNIYSAFSILRNYLKDVKQLIILTHSLVFFRLIYRWFSKSGDEANANSYFSVINFSDKNSRVASIKNLSKNDRDANTEYVLIYRSIKHFIDSNKESVDQNALEALPYPNMLRKLIEIYTTSRRPGWNGENYNKLFKELGMSDEIASKADRFCNDFSHGKADALIGPDMESFSSSGKIIEEIITELERIDAPHFASIKA